MTGYGQFCSMARAHEVETAAASGKEALAHAASISSGGAPTVVVVTDDAWGVR